MAYLVGDGAGNTLNAIQVGFSYGTQQDQLYGLAGDDLMFSGANDDILVGGDGNDQLLAGQGNDDLSGGLGNDALLDSTGNDTVYGGDGDDLVYASIGNDLLVGGNGNDTLAFVYLDHDGTDSELNLDGVVFDLAKTGSVNLGIYGIDTIFGFESVMGSLGNDTLFGNAGANTILGDLGADTLWGRAGNDSIEGSHGGDVLIGGTGKDVIATKSGTSTDGIRDRIDYNAINESGVTLATRDDILGFDKGGTATDDKIDLFTIDANPFLAGNQAFKFVTAFTSAVGQVKAVTSGVDTLVMVDIDKDAGAEMTILVQGVTGLQANDFIL